MATRICHICNKKFYLPRTSVKNLGSNSNVYCSEACLREQLKASVRYATVTFEIDASRYGVDPLDDQAISRLLRDWLNYQPFPWTWDNLD